MKILVLDMETTGVDVTTDAPVQLSLLLVQGNERRILMNTRCNPGIPISPGATEVHHIRNEDVVGMPDAQITCWQAEHLAAICQIDLLVTYNGALFDVPILSRMSSGSFISSLPHIDVLDLAYRYLPTLPSHRLGDVYKHLLGKTANKAHDAIEDVHYTYDVFDSIRRKLGKTIEELLVEMRVPAVYQIMPIGKHKGKLLSEVPKGFAKWMLAQGGVRPDLRLSMEAVLNGTA
jgi:DNA polymerase-3 subunit epsilon